MISQYELLSAARVTGIYNGLQDPRLMPQPMVWNERIPDVPAVDEEISARWIGQLSIADLVADDAQAVVYQQGKFQFETTTVPNIKMGVPMNQAMLNQLNRLQQQFAPGQSLDLFQSWENRTILAVKYGVNCRKEVLKVAMLLDGYSYDRLGIKMNNVTWGMPSQLKITPSITWDHFNGSIYDATPLTDINSLRRTARVLYGKEFNRATMSTSALQMIARTTEFINQVKAFGYGFGGIPIPAIPLQNDTLLKTLIEKVIAGTEGGQFVIEVDDRRYWTQDTKGLITSAPFMPITAVILTDVRDDGNMTTWDFANCPVTESTVARALGGSSVVGSIPEGYGPVAYVTPANVNMNPPGITYWGVARGFPRKHQLQSSAVINTGTYADTIPVGIPFPV